MVRGSIQDVLLTIHKLSQSKLTFSFFLVNPTQGGMIVKVIND